MKPLRLRNTRLCLEELEARVQLSAPSLSLSTNWSGYAVSAPKGSVSSVSGSWTVAAVTGTGNTYSATWVGIDGFSSPTVEQIGTESDTVNGKPQYYAWIEMYPSAAVILPLTIQAGDQISASVSYSTTSGLFTLTLTDATDKQSFQTTESAPQAQRSSAEWIEEAPSSNFGVLPLANFGSVAFSGATATIGGLSGPIDNPSWVGTQVNVINMVSDSRKSEATTFGLTNSGNPLTSAFSVQFVSSGSSSGRHGGHGGQGGQYWWDTNQAAIIPIFPVSCSSLYQWSNPYPLTSQWSTSPATGMGSAPLSSLPSGWLLYGGASDEDIADPMPPIPDDADLAVPLSDSLVPESLSSTAAATPAPTARESPADTVPTAEFWQKVSDSCFMGGIWQPITSLNGWPAPVPMFLDSHLATAPTVESIEE